MGMLVLGVYYNKCCSPADDQWWKRWNISASSLGIIRSEACLSSCFVVMAGVLLRDLFPDPDFVCQFTASDQIFFLDLSYKII